MITKESNGLKWLQFQNLSEFSKLRHAIFTRQGGTSLGSFHSLNLLHKEGDELIHVEKNRQRIRDLFNLPQLISSRIEHADHINEVKSSITSYVGDGLVTQEALTPLLMTHADCQIGLFYDPIQHVVANIHCGWRGNVKNIFGKTVAFLKQKFGCQPENLIVGISPSLGPSHAEFIHYQKEFPTNFWTFQPLPNHFDLWQISEHQLLEAGVLPHHLEIARICTFENEKNFFSYRRNKVCGRNGTIAFLVG